MYRKRRLIRVLELFSRLVYLFVLERFKTDPETRRFLSRNFNTWWGVGMEEDGKMRVIKSSKCETFLTVISCLSLFLSL